MLTVYADADTAGEINGMKSTSGFMIIDPFGATVNWRFVKQSTVAKSTADAEFNSTALTVEKGIWLQIVRAELYPLARQKKLHIRLFNNNQARIVSLTNRKFRASTRHIGMC